MDTKPSESELLAAIERLHAELRGLSERVAALEQRPAGAAAAPEVTEDDLLVIAAAVAAFLGVRAHVRQVRLIQSPAWAQVGRATIHASHRVH